MTNQQVVLEPKNLALAPVNLPRPSLDTLFTSGYEADPFASSGLQMLTDGVRPCRDISLADCTLPMTKAGSVTKAVPTVPNFVSGSFKTT